MSQFWRISAVTGAALFLEAVGAYLVISMATLLTTAVGARLPLPLVFGALAWSFILSRYVQTIRFSLNLRGGIGLFLSIISLLILASLNPRIGFFPVGEILNGDLETVAAATLTLVFLAALWWRGSSLAHDDVTLDTVKTAFLWGLAALIVAAVVDSLVAVRMVSGFLILGFFAVGLIGLALARFAAESADGQAISRDWFLPIGAIVGAVLLVGLLISGLGLGGLDDVTRTLLGLAGRVGELILKPVLLGLGYLAAALVAFGNWLTAALGGGDLSGLQEAQEQMRRFHENLEDMEGGGPPEWVYILLKWLAFLAGASLVGWLLFRVYRFRRLLRLSGEVQEVRESIFSWEKANRDIYGLVGGWWNNLVRRAMADREERPPPDNPRELYHHFLQLTEDLGRPKEAGQTPREHQVDLADDLPPEPVEQIVGSFQDNHYGNRPTGHREMDGLLQEWELIQQRGAEWKARQETDRKESDQNRGSRT